MQLSNYYAYHLASCYIAGVRSDGKEGFIQTAKKVVERLHAVLHKEGHNRNSISSRSIYEKFDYEVSLFFYFKPVTYPVPKDQ